METKEKYYKCISKYNTKNRKSKKIIFQKLKKYKRKNKKRETHALQGLEA